MSTNAVGCLVTTIINTSGAAQRIGFLPPHGQDLDADEELSVFGHLTEAVNRGDRFGARHMKALQDALLDGIITIKSTPAPILYDETLEDIQMLSLDNATLVLSSPCWEESASVAG